MFLLTKSAISESPFATTVSTIDGHVAAVIHGRSREGQGEGHKDTDSGECGGFHFETEINMILFVKKIIFLTFEHVRLLKAQKLVP